MDSVPKRARLFAALGEECRLEIAEELALSDRTPGELIEKLEISSALLAHHLDVLEDAGLVERFESTADRRKRFVRLVEQHRPLVKAPSIPRRVVFVCRQNSARSQLAAAVWRRLAGASARSAGTEPAHEIHPMVFEVARRHDLALQSTTPQRFTASRGDGATVITVCDLRGEVVPLDPVWVREEAERIINRKAESCPPTGESLQHLRLKAKIMHLVEGLRGGGERVDERCPLALTEHRLQ